MDMNMMTTKCLASLNIPNNELECIGVTLDLLYSVIVLPQTSTWGGGYVIAGGIN